MVGAGPGAVTVTVGRGVVGAGGAVTVSVTDRAIVGGRPALTWLSSDEERDAKYEVSTAANTVPTNPETKAAPLPLRDLGRGERGGRDAPGG
jgi:hypothetical protein